MDREAIIKELFDDKYETLSELWNQLDNLLQYEVETAESVLSNIVDKEFLDEVASVVDHDHDVVPLYFGRTVRDLKCVIQDDAHREHEIYFRYNGPKKLSVCKIAIPHSVLQEQVFNSIRDIVDAFKKHLNNLANYFSQLERIDRCCTVVEPVELSFKYDHRRILLDERTWLHVEVTAEGVATNVYLIGQTEPWSQKLQDGLLAWDHDKDIVENIMTIFDLENFPTAPSHDIEMASISTTPSNDVKMLVTPTETIEPAPTEIVESVRIGTGEPTSTETVEPTSTGTGEPTLAETREPAPTETGEPAPTETGEPASAETGEPAPTETGEPAPTGSRALAAIGIGELPPTESLEVAPAGTGESATETCVQVCMICLCEELPDNSGLPQHLCQNPICSVRFHRNCLFQWLVAESGFRAPAFSVVIGSCPNCFQTINCMEK